MADAGTNGASNNGAEMKKANWAIRGKINARLEEEYLRQRFIRCYYPGVNLLPWRQQIVLKDLAVEQNSTKKYLKGMKLMLVQGIEVLLHDYRAEMVSAFVELQSCPESLDNTDQRTAIMGRMKELLKGHGSCCIALDKSGNTLIVAVLDSPADLLVDDGIGLELRGLNITLDQMYGEGVELQVPSPIPGGEKDFGAIFAVDLDKKSERDKRVKPKDAPRGLFFLDVYSPHLITSKVAGVSASTHAAQYNITRKDLEGSAVVTITSDAKGLTPTMRVFMPETAPAKKKRKDAIEAAANAPAT